MATTSTVAVQGRTEARETAGSDGSMLETELNPQIRYDLLARHGDDHVVLQYSPRFIVPDLPHLELEGADRTLHPMVLHGWAGGAEFERRRYHIALYEFGAYGPISTTALLAQRPWNGEGLPARPNPIIPQNLFTRFTLLFSQTQLSVPIKVTHLVTLTPTASFNAWGGADSDSRALMPMMYGPGGGLALDVKASAKDTWKTSVIGARTQPLFELDRQGLPILQAQVEERWTHRYSVNAATELAGGSVVGGDDRSGYRYFPTGEANATFGGNTHDGNTRVALVVRVLPWLDSFSGEVEQRAEGLAAANWTIHQTTLRMQGTFAKVFGNPDSVAEYTLFAGEGGLAYRVSPYVTVDGGARAAQQSFFNAYRDAETFQVTVYAGLTYAPLAWRP